MLIIEVDGDSHDYRGQYDERRTRFLEELGYRAVRFTNEDVMRHLERVLVVLGELVDFPLSRLGCAEAPSALKGEG